MTNRYTWDLFICTTFSIVWDEDEVTNSLSRCVLGSPRGWSQNNENNNNIIIVMLVTL